MTSGHDVIVRWVREVRNDVPRFLRPAAANVRVEVPYGSGKRARLYSYGTHFELARWLDPTDEHDGFWLLNGDRYSQTTTKHQSTVRNEVQSSGAPVLIVPHSSLGGAGIDFDSIVPAEVTQDRFLSERVTVPAAERPEWAEDLTDNGDGTWSYTRRTHMLGESVFSAVYPVYDGPVYGTRRAVFLSAFDHQETTRHYFLCQLPDGTVPGTVAEAFEALKPPVVVEAEAAGLHVTRQGDLFAVPVDLATRQVRRLGQPVKGQRVLGISHAATESVSVPGGDTYARGILRHSPFESWRRPEHRRQWMGDGKTWHLLVKNTVPTDLRGANRAWSLVGNVD